MIETLVVIAIISSVGLTLMGSLGSFYQKNAYIFESASSVDIARRGLTLALTNVREASYGADGSYPIQSIGTSTMTFYADTNGNGVVEKVRFYVLNNTLYRGDTIPAGNPPSYTGQTQATSTVATNLRNGTSTPIFRYYDVTGTEIVSTSSPQNVSSVSVRVDVDLNPLRAPAISTMSGTATLRNLRTQ
jgi:type II secretory pathway pseudopilin PulG